MFDFSEEFRNLELFILLKEVCVLGFEMEIDAWICCKDFLTEAGVSSRKGVT